MRCWPLWLGFNEADQPDALNNEEQEDSIRPVSGRGPEDSQVHAHRLQPVHPDIAPIVAACTSR